MTHKTYFQVSGSVFVAVALVHLLRILSNWNAVIGDWSVPIWVSVLAIVVAGTLAYHAFKFNRV